MDFAVWHEGMKEGTGTWVLAVDRRSDAFLLSGAEGSFYWRPMSDCKLVKAATPDNPQLVMAVQPQQGIALPNGNGLRSLL